MYHIVMTYLICGAAFIAITLARDPECVAASMNRYSCFALIGGTVLFIVAWPVALASALIEVRRE
jgi:hypothetical protein